MAKILNIETSTTVCSVCVSENGNVLAIREESDGYRHAEKIHVFVEEVISEVNISMNQLDAVAVSKGPGSYTGLRIGVSAAKGYCFVLQIPLIGINTLESMAAGWLNENKNTKHRVLCPMIDARRMEVYTACFDNNLNVLLDTRAEIIDSEPFYESEQDSIAYFGDGAEKCIEVWKNQSNYHYFSNGLPSASNLAQLAERYFKSENFEDVAYFEPFYYKDFKATKAKDLIQKN